MKSKQEFGDANNRQCISGTKCIFADNFHLYLIASVKSHNTKNGR